ncbi:uncharacterized protein LOC125241523 isoform X3 [Leguminivora glycinivorella]|uniref:uncharacterized protein LOC125241523 isoform X3 n=1 Tax=Leguminivora glycinivorella TaxID=1035111 RepID=UPI00201074D1|nr:uncharacterized protein LOC125241523 isoform X3 [Leguminivora glycinivorella]XP_048006008.1 uncharacterized protein LOC125241523 isoform X3 [Leguminivora glycinivorella]
MERKWVDRVELVGSCYRLMVEWKGGWPEVRDWCNREGGQLLVIDNEVEHDIICELIGNQEKMFWLGFWHWRDWLLVNQNGNYPKIVGDTNVVCSRGDLARGGLPEVEPAAGVRRLVLVVPGARTQAR